MLQPKYEIGQKIYYVSLDGIKTHTIDVVIIKKDSIWYKLKETCEEKSENYIDILYFKTFKHAKNTALKNAFRLYKQEITKINEWVENK